jgi:peptidoglycan hydrolase CwlO-like protein
MKERASHVVYSEVKSNVFENAPELFYTEGAALSMKVPEFTWNGAINDEDYKEYLRDGYNKSYVPDGRYVLTIKMAIGKSNSETVASYIINVDTQAPEFQLCANLDSTGETILLYSKKKSESAIDTSDFAKEWIVLIDNEKIPVSDILPPDAEIGPLPVLSLPWAKYGGKTVAVTAIDLVGNRSMPVRYEFGQELVAAWERFRAARAELDAAQRALAATQERLESEQKNLDAERERITADQRQLIAGQDKLAADQRQLAADQDKLVEAQRQLAVDQDKLAADQRQLVADQDKLAADQRQLVADQRQLATYQDKIVEAQRQLAVDQDKLAADQRQLAAEQARLTTDQRQLATDIDKLVAGQRQLAAEQAKLAADQRQLAADQARLATGQRQLAADQWQLAVDQDKLAADREDLWAREIALADRPPIPKRPLVIVKNEAYPYLDVPDIIFPPNTNNCISLESPHENNDYLREIASIILEHIDEYTYLHINGFAYPTIYSNKAAMERENKEILIPLSRSRAEYMKKLLSLLGVPEEKIKPHGLGSSEVTSNPNGSWRHSNGRRVRFYFE